MKLAHFFVGISFLYRQVNSLGQCESFCEFYSALKTVGGVCNDLAETPDESALTDCCNFSAVTCDSSELEPVITN
ncbi:hypothetical protein HDV02_003051, partial [Globomyces sp. JEL0801]